MVLKILIKLTQRYAITEIIWNVFGLFNYSTNHPTIKKCPNIEWPEDLFVTKQNRQFVFFSVLFYTHNNTIGVTGFWLRAQNKALDSGGMAEARKVECWAQHHTSRATSTSFNCINLCLLPLFLVLLSLTTNFHSQMKLLNKTLSIFLNLNAHTAIIGSSTDVSIITSTFVNSSNREVWC